MKSAHPFSLKKSIRYSQALRIKRICSIFEEHGKHSQDLIKRFTEKGYNESTIRKQIERVDHLDRSLLLKNCKPKRKDSIRFSVTYNSLLPNIKEIINKHWHICNIDSSFKEIFNSSQLTIAFRENTSLKQLLGRNNKETTKNLSHLHKKQPQVNVPHVTPTDRFAANKFSKQKHLQALKPERPLQSFTKSLSIVTMSSTY